MKYILDFARLIVGNLFIFSGLVKANDPLGFSYKLEEYFMEFGMNWDWLHEILVPLAAFLCIIEILLGVALLVAYRMKIVAWLLLLMIVFFTILTGASAIFEIVRSCGCFGDAIPLTPWQSFYKDLVLMVFILLIFFKKEEIKPYEKISQWFILFLLSSLILLPLSIMLEWYMILEVSLVLWLPLIVKLIAKQGKIIPPIAVILSLIYSLYVTIVAVNYLPFRDFRPYAVGKNIPEQMKLPEGAQPPIYENILVYKNKKTGEVKEMNDEEYNASKIWENKDWEWQSTDSELIQEGDVAPITDLSFLTPNGREFTDKVLAAPKVLLIICYDLSKTSTAHFEEIKELAKQATANGIRVGGVSSAGKEEKNQYIEEHDLNFDFLVADGIVLKTIVRSNPGLIYLEEGTIKGKWHENALPDIEELTQAE